MTRHITSESVRVRIFETTDGEFFIAMRGDELTETGWTAMRTPPREWTRDARLAPALVTRIKRSIAGEPVDFSDVALPRSTPFFARCRRAIQRVPAGRTISYGELAKAAGNAAAARAAGQAMRRNPTPIVVPCHRVVASSGALGGFAGAWAPSNGDRCMETDLKARLLEREQGRSRRSAFGCRLLF